MTLLPSSGERVGVNLLWGWAADVERFLGLAGFLDDGFSHIREAKRGD